MKFKEIPNYFSNKIIRIFRSKINNDITKKVIEYLYTPTYLVVDENTDVVCIEVNDYWLKYLNYYYEKEGYYKNIHFINRIIYNTTYPNTRKFIKDFEINERKRIFKKRIKKFNCKYKVFSRLIPEKRDIYFRSCEGKYFFLKPKNLSMFHYYNS